MVSHRADECGRIVRTSRCRCGEFPQLYCHPGRDAIWLSCHVCGKIGGEAKDIERAIFNWNEINTWGER